MLPLVLLSCNLIIPDTLMNEQSERAPTHAHPVCAAVPDVCVGSSNDTCRAWYINQKYDMGAAMVTQKCCTSAYVRRRAPARRAVDGRRTKIRWGCLVDLVSFRIKRR